MNIEPSEYVSVYETLGAKIDRQEVDIALLVSRVLTAEAHRNKLLEILKKVRACCLFTDDDGTIGITTEVHIDEKTFDQICTAISECGGV